MEQQTVEFPALEDPEFAAKLRAYRTAHCLTQVNVAHGAGTSVISICRWEKGDTKPQGRLYTKLRDFLVEGKELKKDVPTVGDKIRPDQARFSQFGLDLSMLPVDTLCKEIASRGFKVTITM